MVYKMYNNITIFIVLIYKQMGSPYIAGPRFSYRLPLRDFVSLSCKNIIYKETNTNDNKQKLDFFIPTMEPTCSNC